MLRHLLNFFFPFLMMSFAAGATIGDIADTGGGNDGASGADDGSAAGADDGSADAGTQDDGTGLERRPHAGDDQTAADEQQAQGDTDPNALVDLGDGRQVPGKFKKLFDLAKKAGLEKEAKQLYFANQRLARAIPGGVNAAIELAQTVEELGGVEAIDGMREELEAYHADATDFESNPSKWAESGFQENQEAALKAFTHALDYVGDKFPEHYDHLMAKVIVNDLANLEIREMYAVLNGLKDNPRAQQLAKQLADYYNARLETSRQAPEKKPDAQSKELTAREKQVEAREMDVRFKEVNREAFPALKTAVTKSLQLEAKAAGVDLQKLAKEYPGEWRDLLNDIHQRIMKAAIKDTRFIDKYNALVRQGALKRAVAAINQKHERLLETTDLVKEAIADRGLFRKKAAAKATNDNRGGSNNNATAQNQGWTRVAKRPENSKIDWSKTTQAMQLDGKYILADGKKVLVQY